MMRPAIPNLPEDAVKSHHKLLGVVLDRSLKFHEHCLYVRHKVEKRARCWNMIQKPTWGLSISQMRALYVREIQPVLSYACAAWFIHSEGSLIKKKKWFLNKRTIEEIDAIQTDCLVQISRAFAGTDHHIIHRELYLKPASIWLEQVATNARAAKLDAVVTEIVHPYRILWGDAKLCHDAVGGFPKRIAAETKMRSEQQAREWWAKFQKDRRKKTQGTHTPVGARGDWSPEALKVHEKLLRPQSTMLIQLRSERIGLI
ncbi:hypothetical protein CONLIGDRAFT_154171 [Coniochaeta ligniaria NRRL 30616]|uniref:Uncharacterized protein n=1 Tax=Coniochaeta ligniaria NRRL 30616 TaxID=1408157 RepID=A0A1J7IYK7_9PEZI|nr:hypothetical protein CONLIGDRAFT_154171 [Coniochaeta ligniaria NRRL 30616]